MVGTSPRGLNTARSAALKSAMVLMIFMGFGQWNDTQKGRGCQLGVKKFLFEMALLALTQSWEGAESALRSPSMKWH